MTEKHRKRWNTADWFLLLLALLSVGGILLRAWGLRRGKDEDLLEYTVTAVWENVDMRTASCLPSDAILYTAAGERFGRVLSVKEEAYVAELVSNGDLYRLPSERRLEVTLEIAVLGRRSEERFLRGGNDALMAGQEILVYSDWAELPLRIVFVSSEPLF